MAPLHSNRNNSCENGWCTSFKHQIHKQRHAFDPLVFTSQLVVIAPHTSHAGRNLTLHKMSRPFVPSLDIRLSRACLGKCSSFSVPLRELER